jgi:hypothetical protein
VKRVPEASNRSTARFECYDTSVSDAFDIPKVGERANGEQHFSARARLWHISIERNWQALKHVHVG